MGPDVRPGAGRRRARAAGSVVHNAYGYGLFTGGLGIHQGAIELGAGVVPASGGMTPRQVTLIRDLQPDILTCTPSYAIRLGEALAEAGLRPGRGLALRAGLFGAEPWSAQLRARIEELLGLRALDIYGLSEVIGPGVAAECAEAADGLHVNEDHFLVEAVDPVTAEPVPDGTAGELVFSSLTRQAVPLLRYRTGDIAALRRGTCACGRTLVKMSQVTGRRDDMLVIRGVNLYPSEVERVLLEDTSLSPDYLLVVDERAAQPISWRCASPGRKARGQAATELEGKLRERAGRAGLGQAAARGDGAAPRARQGGAGRPVGRGRAAGPGAVVTGLRCGGTGAAGRGGAGRGAAGRRDGAGRAGAGRRGRRLESRHE